MGIGQYIKRGLSYIAYGVRPVDVRVEVCHLNPNKSLEGKRIIVTGGGRGLGLAMSRKFIVEGAKVLICGRNKEILCQRASE